VPFSPETKRPPTYNQIRLILSQETEGEKYSSSLVQRKLAPPIPLSEVGGGSSASCSTRRGRRGKHVAPALLGRGIRGPRLSSSEEGGKGKKKRRGKTCRSS